jgi:hypothetical protein
MKHLREQFNGAGPFIKTSRLLSRLRNQPHLKIPKAHYHVPKAEHWTLFCFSSTEFPSTHTVPPGSVFVSSSSLSQVSHKISPLQTFRLTPPMCVACSDELLFQDSAVGIATGYGLEVLVGSRIFSSPRRPDRSWGQFSLLSNGYRGLFPRGKAAGVWS